MEKYTSPAAYANVSLQDPTNDCGKPPNDSFVMMREPSDPELPWPGFVFGQSTASLWYWATDQVSPHPQCHGSFLSNPIICSSTK